MTRAPGLLAVLLLGLAVAGLLVAPVAPAAGAETDAGFVYLTTELSPAQPTTAANFTLTAVLTSPDASAQPFSVRSAEVRDADGEVHADEAFPGTRRVEPGHTLRLPFSVGFDDPGTYELTLELDVANQAGETFVVIHRVAVTVLRPAPRLEATAAPSSAGRGTALDVTVANGLEQPVRDVELSLASPNVSVQEPSRVAARIDAGASRSFAFTATPATLGRHLVEATLAYTDANGTRRTVTRTLDVAFTAPELDGRVNVVADVARAVPGAETTLNVTVTNGLGQALREFEVAIAAPDVEVNQPRRVGTGLASATERTFAFAVRRPTPGEQAVDVTLTFTTADGIERRLDRTLTVTFAAPANPGNVSLTGLDFDREGDRLRVSGSASNAGDSAVTGVVIGVGSSDAVRPGATEAEFFVGTVPASDFVSFDVNARLLTNETPVTVPLAVSYTVDGVRRDRIVEVSYEAAAGPAADDGGPDLPLVPIAAAMVVVALVAVGVWRWRGGSR